MATGSTRLHVVPWADPFLDRVGVDLRSGYVERFWLPVLGPSATWLLRRLADGLDRAPEGFDVDVGVLAACLGIGGPDSRHAPISRALRRCARFGLVRPMGDDVLAVRRCAGPLPAQSLARLPAPLRAAHPYGVPSAPRSVSPATAASPSDADTAADAVEPAPSDPSDPSAPTALPP